METAVIEREPANEAFQALDEKYERLPIEWVVPSKTNPRTHFDEAYISQLAASVAEKGIIEPLLVRPLKKANAFELVAGECRYRAAKQAGLTHLPSLIRPLTDEQALEHQLIENLHRKDLTPLEEASGFRALIKSNPDKHSAATIAERIGKSASWVWDLMKLLDLIPEAKNILNAGLMTAGHAILIARLKPEDQKRAIDPSTSGGYGGYGDPRGGLWAREAGTLPGLRKDRGKYDGVKVRTVNELKDWIAHHIRFDVTHAAKAAPLQFEPLAQQVEAAAAQPGRGKKVIPITFSHYCPDGAKADDERTYGVTAWKRADGQDKSKTCEHAVLGVVAAGTERYGEAFQVCIARDRCTVHWAESVKAKQKAAKLREQGETKKAAKVEKRAEDSWQARQRREEQERQKKSARWSKIGPPLKKACSDAVAKTKTVSPALLAAVLEVLNMPKATVAGLPKMLLGLAHTDIGFHFYGNEKECVEWAKALGVDVADILKAAEPVQPSGVAKKKAAKGKAA